MLHQVSQIEGVRAVWLPPHVEMAVAGESFYAEHIARLIHAGAHRRGLQLIAWFVPEPMNPHDSNAVGVWISAGQVGHLARDDAALWQPHIMNLSRQYACPVACLAELLGGKFPSVWLRVPCDGPPPIVHRARR